MVSVFSSIYFACFYQNVLMNSKHVDFLFDDYDLCCECAVVVLMQSTPHAVKVIFYDTKANIHFANFYTSQKINKIKQNTESL